MIFGEDYSIRPLDPSDATAGFKAGDPAAQPLKSFLQNLAQEFHQHSIAKTYIAEGSTGDAAGKLLGFVTLIASEIDIRGGYVVDDPAHANRYASLPAVKLARLAVDSRFRGCRIGEAMVDFSLAVVVENVPACWLPILGDGCQATRRRLLREDGLYPPGYGRQPGTGKPGDVH